MRISTATSVLYRYSIQDAISLIARVGFEGVDIWGGRPHVYRHDLSTDELLKLQVMIEDQGLEVVSLMPAFYRYPHSLSNPNLKVREDSIDYMRQCTDNAALLGASIVLVVPDHSLFEQTREDALAKFVESVDVVAGYASRYDLMLGIEILYYDETDFMNSADDALNVINQLGRKNDGVVLDSGTLNLSEEPLEEMLKKLGDLMLQVHINDNEGGREQQNLVPGEGTYDFKTLIQTLGDYNYSGFLTAELTKGYADDPEPALRTTVKRLKTWLKSVQRR